MTFIERFGKRRVLLGGGIFAFVIGVVLFTAGMIQVLGGGDGPTEVVQAALSPSATPSATPSPPSVTPVAGPGTPPLGDQPYTMRIASIGVDAPVATYGLDENQIPEVPTGNDAASIVAWYNFSSQPGTGSNAVFAGHVTWLGEAVFYNLKTLAPGDKVELANGDGTRLVYRVTDVFQVDPADPESLKVMAGTTEDVVTIITCDGAYTETDDPVFGGEYSSRLIVRASLESVTPAG